MYTLIIIAIFSSGVTSQKIQFKTNRACMSIAKQVSEINSGRGISAFCIQNEK